MATETSFLKLVLPANNEFYNSWDVVLNANFVAIDAKMKAHDDEIINARFTKTSIAEFLAVSHNTDGTLKPTDEVSLSRSSKVYGFMDAGGNFVLEDRLELSDFEIFYSRRGRSNILAGLSVYDQNEIINGPKDGLGKPSWLGFSGDKVRPDGSGSQIEMLINGFYQRIDDLEEVTILGGGGTYFLYADYEENGTIVHDGDSSSPPPANPNGVTGSDINGNRTIFSDNTVDFTATKVKPGYILRILGNTLVSGDYVISGVAVESNNSYLQVIGLFKGSLSGLNYVIIDPFKPTLGFESSEVSINGRLFIAEVDFDGAAVTAVRARHYKKTFIGDWRPVDVSGGSPNYEETWNHNFGNTNLAVTIQVSQANDGSAPIENLSLAENTDAVWSIDNTLNFDAGTSDAELTGTVSINKDSDGYGARTARMQHTRNAVSVKNVAAGTFYRDYSNVTRQTGFIRVIVEKKGD